MVVEIFFCFWVGGIVYILVLDILSHFWTHEPKWTNIGYTLHWLLTLDGPSHYASDRHRWVPFVFLVCALLVLVCEAWLKKLRSRWGCLLEIQNFLFCYVVCILYFDGKNLVTTYEIKGVDGWLVVWMLVSFVNCCLYEFQWNPGSILCLCCVYIQLKV